MIGEPLSGQGDAFVVGVVAGHAASLSLKSCSTEPFFIFAAV
ncbi:hypothetical protein USDA257_c54840 [Sinorhizobium fredii USDA 257]|uniref:Uncharacterized protein n=1 Tax=Sinorhizobium fredii (strain USDA 257) TaxID=1185652 RepID=I3XDP3_SINF2|nr:hypothetical protein USDA257_c54840 [Sinorhizobium fredii USDA 257]